MLLRNLQRRPTRTLLTLLGITIGIAAIVALVALSRGIAANYVETTSRSDADLTLQAVQSQGQAITLGTGFDEALAERVRAMPEVKSVSSVLYTLVQVEGTPFFIVFGYEPDQEGINHFHVTEGASLAAHRSRRGGKPLLLGRIAANKLRKGVGDTLSLEETTFRVVGIYETGIAMEDSAAVISLQDAQSLADMPRQVMFIGIRLYNPARADVFREKLARILPRDVEIAGTQVGSMMLEMFEMLDVFAWGVALIAAIVGGVGMMNTMLMSVFERTREIGVLRAVGWRPWRVLSMTLGESLLLSVIGGLIGLGLGAAITRLVASLPAMAGLSQGKVPSALVGQAFVAALTLGAIGGLYPALRASRLPPVEALSYDGGTGRNAGFRVPFGGMAVKNLARQKTRTALTLVGVGIGVISMVMIGSMSEGAVRMFNRMLSGAELAVVEKDQPDTSLSSIDERTLKRIEALDEVQYVTGVILSVIATPTEPFFIITARARSDPALNPRILREGELLSGSRQCLLGWRAARRQGRAVGDRIRMLGASFTVVGIIETGGTFDDDGAIIDLREAQRLLNKPNQVMIAQIKMVDPHQTEALLSRLTAEYPKLLFSRSAEFTQGLPDMASMNQMILGIYVIAVVVGAIALMNTMIMSVYERTREIGVLRAVGWRRALVLREMLYEAVLLTLISGLLGLAASYGLIALMRSSDAMSLYREWFVITPGIAAQSLVFCLVLGALGGVYPAWRATHFSPVEALRYE
jgi:ABC-type antimicrobial peptide transport system permease subunit